MMNNLHDPNSAEMIGRGENFEEEISRISCDESEVKERFIVDVQKQTEKIIAEDRLDKIGFEDADTSVLNLWLE